MLRSAILPAALACLAGGGCLSSPGKGGGDGGPGDGDGGAGGDAGTSELCGTTRALRDDFESEAVDDALWYGEQINVDAGSIEIWATPETLGILQSRAQYRVTGGDLQVNLGLDAYDGGSALTVWLRGAGSSLGIRLDADLLRLTLENGDGDWTYPDSASFSPSWIWWRLWEVDGRVHWGVSTDGEEWDDLGMVEWDEPLAQVEVWVEGQATSSTVDVLEINARLPSERQCAASSFTEEFSDTAAWIEQLEAPCTLAAGGQLDLSTPETASCVVRSRERFDLRGDAVSVQLTGAGDCEPNAILSLAHRGGYADVACRQGDSSTQLQAYTDTGDSLAIDYDAEEHRYLRMRHDPDQHAILWETQSSNEEGWVQFDVSPVDDDEVSAVEIRLSVAGNVSGDGVNGAVWDKVNLTPN